MRSIKISIKIGLLILLGIIVLLLFYFGIYFIGIYNQRDLRDIQVSVKVFDIESREPLHGARILMHSCAYEGNPLQSSYSIYKKLNEETDETGVASFHFDIVSAVYLVVQYDGYEEYSSWLRPRNKKCFRVALKKKKE